MADSPLVSHVQQKKRDCVRESRSDNKPYGSARLIKLVASLVFYVSLCVGGSKAFAGQYILCCPALRAI